MHNFGISFRPTYRLTPLAHHLTLHVSLMHTGQLTLFASDQTLSMLNTSGSGSPNMSSNFTCNVN